MSLFRGEVRAQGPILHLTSGKKYVILSWDQINSVGVTVSFKADRPYSHVHARRHFVAEIFF